MKATQAKENPELKAFVQSMSEAMGNKLLSVVLYGSAARGDFVEKTSDLNLILVLEDLFPLTLEKLSAPMRKWTKKGQPIPQLFTPALIAESADVFPMEMLDLQNSRLVLFGRDAFDGLPVSRTHLRLQCERELREKLMRLREGYLECHDRPADLQKLLVSSFTTFVALFRGCLALLGGKVPVSNAEVVADFSQRAGFEAVIFEQVEHLRTGGKPAEDLKRVFSRYYGQLTQAVDAIDRFGIHGGQSR